MSIGITVRNEFYTDIKYLSFGFLKLRIKPVNVCEKCMGMLFNLTHVSSLFYNYYKIPPTHFHDFSKDIFSEHTGPTGDLRLPIHT